MFFTSILSTSSLKHNGSVSTFLVNTFSALSQTSTKYTVEYFCAFFESSQLKIGYYFVYYPVIINLLVPIHVRCLTTRFFGTSPNILFFQIVQHCCFNMLFLNHFCTMDIAIEELARISRIMKFY